MSKLTDIEIEQRLGSLEAGTLGGSGGASGASSATTGEGIPEDSSGLTNGETYYDVVGNNLYIFDDGVWLFTNPVIYVRYASSVNNVTAEGSVNVQTDVVGFSENPFDAAGDQLAWRGEAKSPSQIAPGNPTVYTWTNTQGPTGPQGLFKIEIFRVDTSTPTTPTSGSGSYSNNTLTPPTGWTTERGTPGTGEDLYSSVAFVDPQGGQPAYSEITTVDCNGLAGEYTDFEALPEEGYFDLKGTTVGKDTPIQNEITDITFDGVTGKTITTDATQEVTVATTNGVTGKREITAAKKQITTITGTGTESGDDTPSQVAVAEITKLGFTSGAAGSGAVALTEETDVAHAGVAGAAGLINETETGTDVSVGVENGGVLVFAGNSGKILTSSGDGTWTARTSNVSGTLRAANHFGSNFLVGGDSGALTYSPNGVTWTSTDSKFGTSTIRGAASNGSIAVLVGLSGKISSSTDGETWTARSSGTTESILFLYYVNGKFWAMARNKVLSSTDGITWSTAFTHTTAFMESIVYSGSLYVAAGTEGTIYTSSDGSSWTERTTPVSNELKGVDYLGGKFYAGGANGAILTSTDGEAWTQQSTPTSVPQVNDFYSLSGTIVAVGSNGSFSSVDGATWVEESFSGAKDGTFLFESKVWSSLGAAINVISLSSPKVTYTFDTSLSANPIVVDLAEGDTATQVATKTKTKLDAELAAGNLTGVTVARTGTKLDIDTTVAGSVADLTTSMEAGTGGTSTATVSVTQQGVTSTTVLTAYTVATSSTSHSNASVSGTLPSGSTLAQSNTILRNHFVNGDISGYETPTAIIDNQFSVTSSTAGAETPDLTLTINAAGTGGTLVSSVTVTTQGVNRSSEFASSYSLLLGEGTFTGTIPNNTSLANTLALVGTHFSNGDVSAYNITTSGTTLVLTKKLAGLETVTPSLTITQGTGGDLAATSSLDQAGTSVGLSGTLTVATVDTPHGNFDLNLSSESNSVAQASQLRNGILSNIPQYTEVSSSGGTVTVKDSVYGNRTNIQITYTTNGTDQTATSPSLNITDGLDGTTTGVLSNWTMVTPKGTYGPNNWTTESNATDQAFEVATFINTNHSADYSAVTTGDRVRVTSTTTGDAVDITFAASSTGTDATVTTPIVEVFQRGSSSNLTTQDSITLNLNGSASLSYEGTSGDTLLEFATALTQQSVLGVVLSLDNLFDIVSNPITPGDIRVKWLYTSTGVVADNTSAASAVTTGNTFGNLSVSKFTTSQQGRAASRTGTPTTATMVFDNSIHTSNVTVEFSSAADQDAQSRELSQGIFNTGGIGASATFFGDTMTVEQTPGAVQDMTVSYSTTGTDQTATNPTVIVVRQGAAPVAPIGAWSAPAEANSTGTPGVNGSTPLLERFYTTNAGRLTDVGNPDSPGTGITWTELTNPVSGYPSDAKWASTRWTISSTVYGWEVFPVGNADNAFPLVNYDIVRSSPAIPTLGDSQWILDAVEAVNDLTGLTYTTQKEFGYSTTVVINYEVGGVTKTIGGRYVSTGSGDAWVTPGALINGDLIASGTISGDALQANAVTTRELNVTPADIGVGSSASSGERIIITGTKIIIFDSANTARVTLGDID